MGCLWVRVGAGHVFGRWLLQVGRLQVGFFLQALAARHGVAATRLISHGVGPVTPVASNDAEAGWAKNRRVELVKQ